VNETDGWARTAQITIEADLPGGLRVHASLDPASPVLADFFSGYDRAFVLPNEKEMLDGFEECLGLNLGASYERLALEYGPYCEVVFTVCAAGDGSRRGGGNFIAYPVGREARTVAMNLNYVFVDREFRGEGLMRRMLGALPHIVARFLRPVAPTAIEHLVFFEQNDPLRVTPEDYATDSRHAGLDQVDRLVIWDRMGAQLLDFDYVQPALSDDQAPDDTLLYSVMGAHGNGLDACVLGEHLRRFFGISVLKGAPLSSSQVAVTQLAALDLACSQHRPVPLLSIAAGLGALPQDRPPVMPSAKTFRSVARGAEVRR
jgi:GNAT superfamily N-acetyltransferase